MKLLNKQSTHSQLNIMTICMKVNHTVVVFLLCLITSSAQAVEWYQTEPTHHIIKRLTNTINISNLKEIKLCENYGCRKRTNISLNNAHIKQLNHLFEEHSTIAKYERLAISRAIAYLESVAGQQSSIYRDKGKNYHDQKGTGYLDCIAESINTLTWLKLLEKNRLLTYHSVIAPVYRKGLLSSQHWAVKVRENSSGKLYVIDSWYRDNGQPAVVQTLNNWNKEMSIPDVLYQID